MIKEMENILECTVKNFREFTGGKNTEQSTPTLLGSFKTERVKLLLNIND